MSVGDLKPESPLQWQALAYWRSKLAGRRMATAALRDDAGELRLEVPALTYASLLGAVFDPIRQNGCDSVPVAIRMLEVLAVIAEATVRPEDREAVRAHAHRIASAAMRSLPDRADQSDVAQRLAAVERTLSDLVGPMPA